MPAQKKTSSFIDWDSIPLGRRPDAEIAEKYGLEEKVVRNRRIRLCIRAYGDPVKPKGINYEAKASRDKKRREQKSEQASPEKG